jgi:hypothetical protein
MFSLRCGQSDIVFTVDSRCHWHNLPLASLTSGTNYRRRRVHHKWKICRRCYRDWCKSLVPTTSVAILPQVLLTPAEDLSLRISSRIFEKFKCRYGNVPLPGDYYSWKTRSKKPRDTAHWRSLTGILITNCISMHFVHFLYNSPYKWPADQFSTEVYLYEIRT